MLTAVATINLSLGGVPVHHSRFSLTADMPRSYSYVFRETSDHGEDAGHDRGGRSLIRWLFRLVGVLTPAERDRAGGNRAKIRPERREDTIPVTAGSYRRSCRRSRGTAPTGTTPG